jgi:Cu/Ag efflux protein CusF/cytochrome c553
MVLRYLLATLLASSVHLFLLGLVAVVAAEKGPSAKAKAPETHHPQGWRFTMPTGDAAKGRAVFEKFECYDCHEVRGENFPYPTDSAPELSQMGPLHPVEYFAESVIHPDAIVPRPFRNAQGKSPMTDFTEKMTLRELIDVSAYIASLSPKGAPKTVTAHGRVVALVPETQEIVVEHGEIKGFMDAMTMGYKVSPTSLLKSVTPGDKIRFTIDTVKRAITKIEKLKN